MISKKTTFWISLIAILTLLGSIFIDSGGSCYYNSWCRQILDFRNLISPYLIIFPVVLFWSLVTYKMRDGVYTSWMKFAQWYILVFVILTYYLISSDKGGGFFDISGWGNAVILFCLLVIFFIISFFVIMTKRTALQEKEKIAQK